MRQLPRTGDMSLVTLDMGLSVADKQKENRLSNLWLAHSCASCHMTFDETGMFDCRAVHSKTKIGNSQTMTATKIGKK
jgi:hypothetical protein